MRDNGTRGLRIADNGKNTPMMKKEYIKELMWAGCELVRLYAIAHKTGLTFNGALYYIRDSEKEKIEKRLSRIVIEDARRMKVNLCPSNAKSK